MVRIIFELQNKKNMFGHTWFKANARHNMPLKSSSSVSSNVKLYYNHETYI